MADQTNFGLGSVHRQCLHQKDAGEDDVVHRREGKEDRRIIWALEPVAKPGWRANLWNIFPAARIFPSAFYFRRLTQAVFLISCRLALTYHYITIISNV
jgi:hypothetical protein